ncbi:Uncharacterized protein Adt_04799 [Abeliophyllum distichum]|uniref:Uncharacterized protein n=1 Tax=Abeliophyllum distichum TaxID=126358 RepID=A0ABD1V2B4_9LAMI
MRLPLHPMLRRILRAYDLAPTQPKKFPKKKCREEEAGCGKSYSFGCPVIGKRVFDDPEPDLDVPSVYGIANTSQRKAIEYLSRKENKEAVEASKVIEVDDAPEGDVPLSRKKKSRASGAGTPREALWRSSIIMRRAVLRLFRGRARIPDVVLRNVPFYPSMGAQVVKKYFTPKWEEFSSHGDLEDVLEASLASAIRASAMQMKILGEFRARMQEQRKLIVEASQSDKEHRQALEGLQTALDSARKAYEKMEADLKESDSNVLNLTKQLDNANATQKVQNLRGDLESFENGKKDAEAEVARLMGEKKEMEAKLEKVEAKLENAEAEFVVNFLNTEAYTNFSDYFARVGQQEVLIVRRKDHPSFDIGSLEARFPPPNAEGEEDS